MNDTFVCEEQLRSGHFNFGPAVLKNDHCSYCGSLSGDLFMGLLESSKITLGPTDKNYKVYVEYNDGSPGTKFYFLHLTVSQQNRFIQILNSGKMKISYPGHFYNLPFFIGVGQ